MIMQMFFAAPLRWHCSGFVIPLPPVPSAPEGSPFLSASDAPPPLLATFGCTVGAHQRSMVTICTDSGRHTTMLRLHQVRL